MGTVQQSFSSPPQAHKQMGYARLVLDLDVYGDLTRSFPLQFLDIFIYNRPQPYAHRERWAVTYCKGDHHGNLTEPLLCVHSVMGYNGTSTSAPEVHFLKDVCRSSLEPRSYVPSKLLAGRLLLY